MPTPATSKLPKPRSEDEFEDIVADVLEKEWGVPVQRNGRRGQRQNGVDVFSDQNRDHMSLRAAQCKNVDKLTITEINAEIAKAETFRPPLDEFWIVASLDRDVELQEAVRLVNVERVARKQFSVGIWFWDELARRVKDHTEILRAYFGQWLGELSVPPPGQVVPAAFEVGYSSKNLAARIALVASDLGAAPTDDFHVPLERLVILLSACAEVLLPVRHDDVGTELRALRAIAYQHGATERELNLIAERAAAQLASVRLRLGEATKENTAFLLGEALGEWDALGVQGVDEVPIRLVTALKTTTRLLRLEQANTQVDAFVERFEARVSIDDIKVPGELAGLVRSELRRATLVSTAGENSSSQILNRTTPLQALSFDWGEVARLLRHSRGRMREDGIRRWSQFRAAGGRATEAVLDVAQELVLGAAADEAYGALLLLQEEQVDSRPQRLVRLTEALARGDFETKEEVALAVAYAALDVLPALDVLLDALQLPAVGSVTIDAELSALWRFVDRGGPDLEPRIDRVQRACETHAGEFNASRILKRLG